jgi:Ca-activated chloride channel family protein
MRRLLARSFWVLTAYLLSTASAAWGQGLLVHVGPHDHVRLPRPIHTHVPAPPESYKIGEIEVQGRITDQVARVQVSQTFVNTGSRQMEVSFVFPLPYDGAIDQLTLLVDGQEYPAKLLPRDEARKVYESIVRKNKDPALLEWIGTGMFQTSIFPVPPGAERKVTLRYSQLCRFDHGLTDFLFPLSTAKYTSQPIDKIRIRFTLESKAEIKNVYSPTHSVEIERDKHRATVAYRAEKQIPSGDFRLFFDVGQGPLAARVISYKPKGKEDGYFLLLANPEIKDTSERKVSKTVLFVVDRSGSMSGQKIEQAKGALKFVLNNLSKGDLFNIVAYDSTIESFRPELQRFDDETRGAAIGFVDGLYAGGSTNIDGALKTALGQLTDERRPNYVLFLTDGLPTVGERNEMQIVVNAQRENKVHARIISFGVGYDVNGRLLDKLVRENFGQSEYVRPNEDIEAHVSSLFRRIQSPVMTDVKLEFALDMPESKYGQAVNRLYPKKVVDLFAGEQLVLVGRYKHPGDAKVTVTGLVGDRREQFHFPAKLVSESKDESQAFVEKLWATRRIGEIIDELDLKGRNEELVKELVDLSTRHGILTPYTSFLSDETTRLSSLADNAKAADERLDVLRERTAGESGFSQRAAKGAYQNAMQPNAPAAASAPSGAGSSAVYRDALKDQDVVVNSVRRLGNKSFFCRNGQWNDSTVTEEQEKRATRIKQYSPEFFDLVKRQDATRALYFAFDEPVLLNLDGDAYLIEP